MLNTHAHLAVAVIFLLIFGLVDFFFPITFEFFIFLFGYPVLIFTSNILRFIWIFSVASFLRKEKKSKLVFFSEIGLFYILFQNITYSVAKGCTENLKHLNLSESNLPFFKKILNISLNISFYLQTHALNFFNLAPKVFINSYFSSKIIYSLCLNWTIFIFSLLSCAIFDAKEMLVPRVFTIFLVPIWILKSFFQDSPVTFFESLIGAIFGYGSLWLINELYKKRSGQNGIGVGDMEILAMIGSFLGPIRLVYCVNISTALALFYSFIIFIVKRSDLRKTKLPFASFLSLGTIIFLIGPKILEAFSF